MGSSRDGLWCVPRDDYSCMWAGVQPPGTLSNCCDSAVEETIHAYFHQISPTLPLHTPYNWLISPPQRCGTGSGESWWGAWDHERRTQATSGRPESWKGGRHVGVQTKQNAQGQDEGKQEQAQTAPADQTTAAFDIVVVVVVFFCFIDRRIGWWRCRTTGLGQYIIGQQLFSQQW